MAFRTSTSAKYTLSDENILRHAANRGSGAHSKSTRSIFTASVKNGRRAASAFSKLTTRKFEVNSDLDDIEAPSDIDSDLDSEMETGTLDRKSNLQTKSRNFEPGSRSNLVSGNFARPLVILLERKRTYETIFTHFLRSLFLHCKRTKFKFNALKIPNLRNMFASCVFEIQDIPLSDIHM